MHPIYRKPKMVTMATSLRTSKSTMSSSDSLTPKTHPLNWLPWQRPSAPMNPHLTHNSYGPSEPITQTVSLSVQPSLRRRPSSVPILYNGTSILLPKIWPFPWGDLDPHLIHGSPGPPKSSTQTAARSVQPFLHSSLV